MSRPRPSIRVAAVAVAALLVLAGVGAPALGAAGAASTPGGTSATPGSSDVVDRTGGERPGTADGATLGADGVAAQEETPTENDSSVQQRDPEELSEEGDLGRLSSHLGGRLAGQLAESSLLISQGEYERADALLGDEYDDALGKYVEVQGEIEGEADTAESFDRARDQQRAFGETVSSYRETLAAYREARETGNETRAREPARELAALATEADRTGANLTRSLEAVSNETDADLSPAIAAGNETRSNVTETTEEVVTETFVETTLTVRTAATTGGFDDPATVEGRLRAENGTVLGNRTVTVVVGERTYRVDTDANGSFALEYRPVGIAADTSTVGVAFEPATGSPYFRSEASLELSVAPTTATVELTELNASVAFGDRLTAEGVVAVDGTPVPGVAVAVALGGERLGTATTDADGRFRFETALPATVPAGDAELRVVGAEDGRAVAVEPTTATVAVRETATALELDAVSTDAEAGSVSVRGRLLTAEGAPVAAQSVELRIDGTLLATVRTRSDGSFRATVEPPADGRGTLVAAFGGTGTNLGPSSVERSLRWGSGGGEDGVDRPVVVAAVAAVAVLVLGGALWWRRRERAADVDDGGDEGDAVSESDERSAPSTAESLLAAARESLASGDGDGAARQAFAAVRAQFGTEGDGRTHWEVFDAVAGRVDEGARPELRRLTERFERAAFGPSPLEPEEADDAVAAAEALIGDADPRSDGGRRAASDDGRSHEQDRDDGGERR